MKEIIYNRHNLEEKDITETVVRIKVLLINGDNIILGNSDNIYQFPGGHLEEVESFDDCLKRELLEETGIEISDDEIDKPIMKLTHMNKDWPDVGKNRKSEIYYYVVKTNKIPNLDKTNYTIEEKKGNFRLDLIPIDKVLDVINNNIPNNEKNKIIVEEMIQPINEYLSLNKKINKIKNTYCIFFKIGVFYC